MLAAFITVILGLQHQRDSLPTSPSFHTLYTVVGCARRLGSACVGADVDWS
jgi:hypothetical protein